jgi:WD40 repeat protein
LVSFDPDEKLLAVANELWDFRRGVRVGVLDYVNATKGWQRAISNSSSVDTVKFVQNGKRLLMAFYGRVLLWDVAKRQLVSIAECGQGAHGYCDLRPDGKAVAFSRDDAVCGIYRLVPWTPEGDPDIWALWEVGGSRTAGRWYGPVAFTPDGKFLITGNYDGGVAIRSADSGRIRATKNSSKASMVAIMQPGKALVVCGSAFEVVTIP